MNNKNDDLKQSFGEVEMYIG
ncbi:MAG: hypothetical protein K0R54_4439, partial [Clostridiaceae bacterium]|nr:hypothetical protein [Clostridiaceae bacterium]